jgi:hypothetical protein
MYQVTEGLLKSDCGPQMSNFVDPTTRKLLESKDSISLTPISEKATPPHQQNNNK